MTLIEIVVAGIITSILAAIAVPSMMGFMSSNQVKGAQDQLQSAFRDAQRQAMRLSGKCEIEIQKVATTPKVQYELKVITDDTDKAKQKSCLVSSSPSLPAGVEIKTNLSGDPPKLTFNFKGQSNKGGTIVFYDQNFKTSDVEAGNVRCLVIAPFLGMMRVGSYEANPTRTLDPEKCNTTENTL